MSAAKQKFADEEQKVAPVEQKDADTNAVKDPESSDEPQPMINEKALLAYDLQVDD